MRTFVLLLAISTIVLSKSRLVTTKAKMKGMTSKLKNLSAASQKYYGNPFPKNNIPMCKADEFFNYETDKDGLLVGDCRPLVKPDENCPDGPANTTAFPYKQSIGNGFRICNLRSGKTGQRCPIGSIINGLDYCVYKQKDPTAVVINYEDGYSKSGANPKCSDGEVFGERTIVPYWKKERPLPEGVKYGICLPKVSWNEKCPATPFGVNAFAVSNGISDGNKECNLSCDGNLNRSCPLGSQCIMTDSSWQGSSFSCFYLKSPSHCDFDDPYAKGPENPQCKDAGVVDAVQFVTKDGKKADICAPKAPQDIQCPLFDTPENKRRVSLAVKDQNGTATHCQLACDSDTDCAQGSQCLTIDDDGKDTKICLYNTPAPSKTHDKFESSYPTADRLMLKPKDE